MTSRWALVAAAAALLGATGAEPGVAQEAEWRYLRLDMDVRIDPVRSALEVRGRGHLELVAGHSSDVTMAINSRNASMEWERVTLAGADGSVEIVPGTPQHLVRLSLAEPLAPGGTVAVEFTLRYTQPSSQLMVTEGIALGSWVEAWYPLLMSGDRRTYAAAGDTRFHLPLGWHVVTNGQLVSIESNDSATVQLWRTEEPVHRSFAAAPYRVARTQAGGREIGVYLLRADSASAARQAELLARSIAALEAVWGPYPYSGYAIAEIPAGSVTWAASSEQGFIMATTPQLAGAGSLPLVAHEAAHAWWGNRVSTSGPGSLLVSESLAQYGAAIAIEALEGTDAMNEFLRFSRPGYNSYQSAAGYFEIVRLGGDKPMALLANDRWDHNLSDAKGHWIYHMLRRRLGDERFFAILRGIQEDRSGQSLSLAQLRAAIVEAVPNDEGLSAFLAQWFDRTGTPVLEHRWWAVDRGAGVHLEIEQRQTDLYDLTLTVEIELRNGHRVRRSIRVTDRTHVFMLPVHSTAIALRVDPDHELLHWRPEYGPIPPQLVRLPP